MIPVRTDIQIPYTYNGEERGVEGEVRAIQGQLKVYNGGAWTPVHTTAFVDNIELGTVVEWAREKRNEELMWKSLANENKAVKIALDNLEQARQQLDITAKLAREYETTS